MENFYPVNLSDTTSKFCTVTFSVFSLQPTPYATRTSTNVCGQYPYQISHA